MYHWCKNEAITAERLNLSQTRPYMEAVNKSGVDGGIDVTAVDTSVLCCMNDCDPGSVEPVSRVEVAEHEAGNLRYGWNRSGTLPCGAGIGRWQLESGASGVTGQEQYVPSNPSWVDNCYFMHANCSVHVWDKITTNIWGTPTSVCRVYDTCCNHDTEIWNPSAREGGTVWRHIGSVTRNCTADIGERELGYDDTHVWCAVNFNSAVIMPVARPVGRSHWDCININSSSTPEAYARYCLAHYLPIAGSVNGNTEPILSIGELGGTVVKLVCSCGDIQGAGIAAGIEIYDKETIRSDYNWCTTRPQWTEACGSIGYGGSVKLTALKSSGGSCGTCSAPWQFLLTTTPIRVCISCADIGSSVINIMGDNFWDIMGDNIHGGYYPPSTRVIASANGQETFGQDDYHWGQFGLSYRPDQMRNFYDIETCLGLVSPYVASVVPRSTTNTVLQGTAGEIKCGVLGIPVARWDPTTGPGNGTAISPYQSEWNAHGGIIRGILADIPLKYAMGGNIVPPHIDSYGFIHIYAPLIPCDMPVERFNNTDCYLHYTCIYNLCGQVHRHDPWNR